MTWRRFYLIVDRNSRTNNWRTPRAFPAWQFRLCLKTLWPHDDTESLWPLGAATRTGSVDPSSRCDNADEAILCRLRWAGNASSASLSPLVGSIEPDLGRRLASKAFPAHRGAIGFSDRAWKGVGTVPVPRVVSGRKRSTLCVRAGGKASAKAHFPCPDNVGIGPWPRRTIHAILGWLPLLLRNIRVRVVTQAARGAAAWY
jgi:hypothetical protein